MNFSNKTVLIVISLLVSFLPVTQVHLRIYFK